MSVNCSGVQESMAMERTKEMCTPRERWTPEQSRQNTVPKDTDAH